MASFTAIRAGLAANLRTIPGLTAYATNPDEIDAPAAIVGGFRRVQYGQSLGGPGAQSLWEIPIRVFVGDATEPAAQSDLDAFIATDGVSSVLLALHRDPTLGVGAKLLRVVEAARYGIVQVGDYSYLAFEVIVEVRA